MRDKGAGRLGCLVMAVLIVALAFVASKVVPVYLDKLDFEEDLERMVARSRQWTIDEVQREVLKLATARGFETSADGVQVERIAPSGEPPTISVDVSYRRTIDLLGYYFTLSFQSNAKRQLVSL
jgi:hypothetical protein